MSDIPQDKELRNGGYRLVIAGKYICVYRLIMDIPAHAGVILLAKHSMKMERTYPRARGGDPVPHPYPRPPPYRFSPRTRGGGRAVGA